MGAFDVLTKQAIDDIYTRLMIANDGLSGDDWDEKEGMTDLGRMTQNSPNRTLDRLAYLTQFEKMMYARRPKGAVIRLPVMPHLSTPILPKQLHRLLARILEEHQGNVMWIVRLLAFIFECGYTAPPTVWLPVKHMQVEFDDSEPANFEGVLPSEHLTWCAWINDAYAYTDGDTLTADNWHEWHPSKDAAN